MDRQTDACKDGLIYTWTYVNLNVTTDWNIYYIHSIYRDRMMDRKKSIYIFNVDVR